MRVRIDAENVTRIFRKPVLSATARSVVHEYEVILKHVAINPQP